MQELGMVEIGLEVFVMVSLPMSGPCQSRPRAAGRVCVCNLDRFPGYETAIDMRCQREGGWKHRIKDVEQAPEPSKCSAQAAQGLKVETARQANDIQHQHQLRFHIVFLLSCLS